MAYRKKRENYYDKASEMYKNGFTTREISETLNIGREFISKILKETSTEIRKDKGLPKRRIFRYDTTGNFIDEFSSITECCNKTGINSHSIEMVLNGTFKFTSGFFLHTKMITKEEFNNLLIKFEIEKSKKKIANGFLKYEKIDQMDLEGNLIKRWDGVTSVIKEFGISNCSNLYNAIKKEKIYRGFIWVPYRSF